MEYIKATGIVRRIDELGRIVIPKEIRRTMRIREGEMLEIFTDGDGGVIFKKYSPIGEVGRFTSEYAEAINRTSGIPVAVCDLDNVIAVAGLPKKDFISKPISSPISALLKKRGTFSAATPDDSIHLTQSGDGDVSFMLPITSDGSVIGGIMSLKKSYDNMPDDTEKKLIQTGATFLSTQMQVD